MEANLWLPSMYRILIVIFAQNSLLEKHSESAPNWSLRAVVFAPRLSDDRSLNVLSMVNLPTMGNLNKMGKNRFRKSLNIPNHTHSLQDHPRKTMLERSHLWNLTTIMNDLHKSNMMCCLSRLQDNGHQRNVCKKGHQKGQGHLDLQRKDLTEGCHLKNQSEKDPQIKQNHLTDLGSQVIGLTL